MTQRIFIAGAGPVGLTAAIELRRRGFEPRIVDPDLSPSPQSRALAVNARTLDLMQPSGVTDMLLAAGNRIRRLVIRRGTRVVARIELSRIPHRFNFMLAIPQSQTEAILARRFSELGGRLERGVALADFSQTAPIGLSLANGERAEADILVGADGSHSLVRKKLSLGFPGETQEQLFGLADVTLDSWPFAADTAVLTVMNTHLAPYIPLGEGYGRFISTRGDCLNNLPADAKVASFEWETDFRISYRQVASYQQGNAFLAGDAAHIHSPAGGRGMNLGMEDACWLAWLLEQGRQAEYTSLRHPQGEAVLKYTHSFTEFVRGRGSLQDMAILFALPLAMRIPAVSRRLFSIVTGLDTPPAPWLT
jgi:2-polyprenyl-6-methoxyphenol hydroxylase-like FAD-dependent oxidoreductase